MKQLLQYAWFRFFAAAGVASVTVVTVVGLGIRYFDKPEEDPLPAEFEFVEIVNLAENPALAEAIRKEREKQGVQEDKLPPPPVLPERMVSGFVHLEYTINPDGTVSDVRVVGAAPSGVYEERAIAEASRSMHAPAFNDAGEAVARRVTEIVEFSVPASELSNSGLKSE
ncbi:MAG TPA: energy transducer TonB [Gammaproteobacteria bacterium]